MKVTKLPAKIGYASTLAYISLTGAIAQAAPTSLEQGANSSKPDGAPTDLMGQGGIFEMIANTLIFLVGAIAVIMLILGGLKYVLSGGNSSNIESAKNTILYAIIGIVVAILSFAAVNFVINQF